MRAASDTNVWGAVHWTDDGRYEVITFTNCRESAQEAAARHPGAFVIFRGGQRPIREEGGAVVTGISEQNFCAAEMMVTSDHGRRR